MVLGIQTESVTSKEKTLAPTLHVVYILCKILNSSVFKTYVDCQDSKVKVQGQGSMWEYNKWCMIAEKMGKNEK